MILGAMYIAAFRTQDGEVGFFTHAAEMEYTKNLANYK